MSWSRQDGPRGYHHGNLKEALIRAALELIAKKGPAGFTFAEAARWAGVSPAALAYLATATLHTLAIRSRAGLPRKELEALASAAIAVICGKK